MSPAISFLGFNGGVGAETTDQGLLDQKGRFKGHGEKRCELASHQRSGNQSVVLGVGHVPEGAFTSFLAYPANAPPVA